MYKGHRAKGQRVAFEPHDSCLITKQALHNYQVTHNKATYFGALRTFFFFFFFNLTCSRWTSSLPSCLWSLRVFPVSPRFTPYHFLSRCKFSTLTTRQPMAEFYLLTSPRFPFRKKEHKSYFGKNRTHDFCTSRCAGYLLDHSGDEGAAI